MPQAKPLTAVAIKAIKPPTAGRVDYPDAATPGLFLRVTASKKVWAIRLRTPRGTQERYTLGEHDEDNDRGLAWARAEARARRYDVQQKGADPRAEREAIKAAHEAKKEQDRLTLGVLIGDWRRIRLKDRTPKYGAEAERALKHAFAKQWDKPASALNRKTVETALEASSAAMANRTCIYGRAAFRWAVDKGRVPTNPFAGHDVDPLVKRDRVLSDAELLAVWQAAADEAAPFGPIVRLLILTGQRREEVAGMAWAEISEDRTTWTLPGSRTKNGVAHIVPLSDLAQAQLPKDRGKGLVFPGDGSLDPDSKKLPVFCGWSRAKSRLDATIAKNRGEGAETMDGWRLHDLRRTCATDLQRLGIAMQVTEAVLNHTSGSKRGVAGIYQRYDYAPEKRSALDAWAAHVSRLVNGQDQASNVVTLAKVA